MSMSGALRRVSWLAGAMRSWHMVVRSVSISMISVGSGWAIPKPERAARVERTARRMVMVRGLKRRFCVKGRMVVIAACRLEGDRERFIYLLTCRYRKERIDISALAS